MPTPLDFARQFYAVEYQLAVLKGMFQQLAGVPPTAYPPVPPPAAYAMPPTEAPEPREPTQHFDGKHWRPGPSPVTTASNTDTPNGSATTRWAGGNTTPTTETNVEGLDVPPGQG